jgi:hypothetical protein
MRNVRSRLLGHTAKPRATDSPDDARVKGRDTLSLGFITQPLDLNALACLVLSVTLFLFLALLLINFVDDFIGSIEEATRCSTTSETFWCLLEPLDGTSGAEVMTAPRDDGVRIVFSTYEACKRDVIVRVRVRF